MVRIRLRRAGGKGQPTHRIVAANRESPRDGRFIEILGDYNPRTEPSTIRTKEDRIYYWLSVGAQPSDAVLQVFRVVGLMERYQRYKDGEDIEVLVAEGKQVEKDRNVDPRTRRDDLVKVGSPKKKEEPVEEVAADVEADVPDAETEADVPDAVTEADVAKVEPAADEVEEQEVQETEAVVAEVEAAVPDTDAEAVDADAEAEVEEEPQAEEVVDAEAPVEEVADEEAAVTDEEPQAEVEEEVEVEEEQVEVEEAPVEEAVEVETELKITDAARKLAEENGIDLSAVKGTGKDGAILKSDISKLIKD